MMNYRLTHLRVQGQKGTQGLTGGSGATGPAGANGVDGGCLVSFIYYYLFITITTRKVFGKACMLLGSG